MTKLSEKIKAQLPAHEGITKAMSMRTLQDWLKDAEHLEGGGWIPVGERLPEHGQTVLTCNADEDTGEIFIIVEAFDAHDWMLGHITHWMKLPLPPNP